MTTKKKNETQVTEEAKIKRQFGVPSKLYYEMVEENTNLKKEGKKETTEQTMLNLMEDGLKLRKLIASGKLKKEDVK